MAEERGMLPSSRHASLGTKKLSSSRPITSPYRRTLSRVCSNVWFGACMPDYSLYSDTFRVGANEDWAEADEGSLFL